MAVYYSTKVIPQLNEVQIQFSDSDKFGQVVILQGGPQSGKNFLLDRLIGIEGKVLDIDQLKPLVMKSKKLKKRIKEEYQVDVSEMDLAIEKDQTFLHRLIDDELNLLERTQKQLFQSILAQDSERKPNLILNTTLKDFQKFDDQIKSVLDVGYKQENIHIVWIINDVEVQLEQNLMRDRQVKKEILIGQHIGVQNAMMQIIDLPNLQEYMDGYIYFLFQKSEELDKHGIVKRPGDTLHIRKDLDDQHSPGYFKRADYVKIKDKGYPSIKFQGLDKEIKNKIVEYIPDLIKWN